MISSRTSEPGPIQSIPNLSSTPAIVGPRALIADDQPDVLVALHLLLKGEGYQTESVTSPAAALKAVEERGFDLVLMDLNYARDTTSGCEGLDLLAKIRELDRTLPVVVMTAWGSIELAVEAIRGGSGDFIQKPWDNSHLLSVVRKQLELGWRARRRQQQALALEQARVKELAEASRIQQRLLPGQIPQLAGCQISSVWQPAGEVSGDYFDLLRFDDRSVALCIADVTGKGLPAALLMSNVQAAVKSIAAADLPPSELCVQINRLVCGNVDPGKLITFCYALVDLQRRQVTYANAGHNAPILVRRNGESVRLTAGGLVFGFSAASTYEQGRLELLPGDRLILYTDGLSEARNAQGIEFGEDRLRDLISANRALGAVELQQQLLTAIGLFAGDRLQDDATMVVLALE